MTQPRETVAEQAAVAVAVEAGKVAAVAQGEEIASQATTGKESQLTTTDPLFQQVNELNARQEKDPATIAGKAKAATKAARTHHNRSQTTQTIARAELNNTPLGHL